MLDGLHIRLTTPEDMPTFERVLGRSHARFYERRLGRRGAVLSAWLDKQLAGAVCVSLEPADEWILKLILRKVPFLYRLQVPADIRNRGIGTALITAAEVLLRDLGCRRVAFGVDEHNLRAARLYVRLGYREWPFGWVQTFREDYNDDGQVIVIRDRCRMYTKRLA